MNDKWSIIDDGKWIESSIASRWDWLWQENEGWGIATCLHLHHQGGCSHYAWEESCSSVIRGRWVLLLDQAGLNTAWREKRKRRWKWRWKWRWRGRERGGRRKRRRKRRSSQRNGCFRSNQNINIPSDQTMRCPRGLREVIRRLILDVVESTPMWRLIQRNYDIWWPWWRNRHTDWAKDQKPGARSQEPGARGNEVRLWRG